MLYALYGVVAWPQLATDDQDGPFMQAVLDLLGGIANAAPSLMHGCKCAVEALLVEEDSELAVLAARLLSAASSAARFPDGGKQRDLSETLLHL